MYIYIYICIWDGTVGYGLKNKAPDRGLERSFCCRFTSGAATAVPVEQLVMGIHHSGVQWEGGCSGLGYNYRIN